MNIELFNYKIGSFRALQAYPCTKMTKRYFQGFRENEANKLYRIAVYSYDKVDSQKLIERLVALQSIQHEVMSKVALIYQQTNLIDFVGREKEQKVIAVVFEDVWESSFVNIYDFMMQIGSLSQKITQYVTYQLLNFIKFMEQKGFINSFNSNDVFINLKNGKINIDGYGDRQFYKLKDKSQQNASSIWQLGTLLFTLLKGNPPYSRKVQSDPLYRMLDKQDFQKFWGLIPSKPVLNPSIEATNFLNLCFKKQMTLQVLKQGQWLRNFEPQSEQQRAQQICQIVKRKQQKRLKKQLQQKQKKQKMKQAVTRDRILPNHNRGTHPGYVENFLDILQKQQEKIRVLPNKDNKQNMNTFNQKAKIKLSQTLALLSCNDDTDVKIYDIYDNKDSIRFKIKSQIGGSMSIDNQAELGFELDGSQLKYVWRRIEGSFFQTLWINNYVQDLCLSA